MPFIGQAAGVNGAGRLTVDGLEVSALAREYGTPLYIMNEDCIRENCRRYQDALAAHYPGEGMIAYASKALSFTQLYTLMNELGMSVDVVSGGELYTALRGGFPAQRIYFHGNNKTDDELSYALASGVGCIVVDNAPELHRLNALCGERGTAADISFRIKPGIEAHTHDFVQTGQIDSKFGFALETGEAAAILREAVALPHVKPVGVHCHIGSQIFQTSPFAEAAARLFRLMIGLRDSTGITLRDLNVGGGFGIQYIPADEPGHIHELVRITAQAVAEAAGVAGYPLPRLIFEPGRSIVGPAGLTAYTVGSVKDIPGIRTIVAVDGGMGDNIRYALYDAAYYALAADRPLERDTRVVSLAGRYCESGDFIAKDIPLAPVEPGDIVTVLATGAFNYSMASNYNRVPRAPIVMVSGGQARLVVRRETYADIVACDL